MPKPEAPLVINLFDDIPARADGEIFTEVLLRENVRVERIVSTGQSTLADKPHVKGMTNGCYSLPALLAFALRAKPSAIYAQAITY